MARNLANEPVFATSEIQGDILPGLPKNHEHLIFFHIQNVGKFKKFVKGLSLTSMQECLAKRAAIKVKKAAHDDTIIPTPGLNIAFTFKGLETLGVAGMNAVPSLKAFKDGMASRQQILNDPPSGQWTTLKPDPDLHGVFVLAGASHAEVVDIISLRLAPPADNGWKRLGEQIGQVRPDPVRGHEHFGYADGVSQPGVRGTIDDGSAFIPSTGPDDDQGMEGQDLLWPGEFVFGYPGQDEMKPITEKGPVAAPPVPFMNNGSFFVFRRLAQLVPEFNALVNNASSAIAGSSDKASPDLLGAQMVGRWKSGAPIINAPMQDDATIADGTAKVNAFEFNGDRTGLKCPWAAHVRKAYPRNDVLGNTTPSDDESNAAESKTQTHRLMRRGIAFGPEVTEDEAMSGTSAGGDQTRGLLFMCYQTSLDKQFEFVQQRWADTTDFTQPGSGIDPIIGQSANVLRPFLGAAPFSGVAANKPTMQLKGFVHMQGGAYFFVPSIKELKAI